MIWLRQRLPSRKSAPPRAQGQQPFRLGGPCCDATRRRRKMRMAQPPCLPLGRMYKRGGVYAAMQRKLLRNWQADHTAGSSNGGFGGVNCHRLDALRADPGVVFWWTGRSRPRVCIGPRNVLAQRGPAGMIYGAGSGAQDACRSNRRSMALSASNEARKSANSVALSGFRSGSALRTRSNTC